MSLSKIPTSPLNLLSLPGVTASFICSALRTLSFDELPSGPVSSYFVLGIGKSHFPRRHLGSGPSAGLLTLPAHFPSDVLAGIL